MKRIKWENIAFILAIICRLIFTIELYNKPITYLEIIESILLALLVRYTIKYVRTNTKAFKGELKSFFKE